MARRRCHWCGWRASPESGVLIGDEYPEKYRGWWCKPNCSVALYQAKHARSGYSGDLELLRILQEILNEPDDCEWDAAPYPQQYSWWDGPKTREEFEGHCGKTYHNDVSRLRPGYTMSVSETNDMMEIMSVLCAAEGQQGGGKRLKSSSGE